VERAIGVILYGLFYGIGYVLMLLVELPFWLLMNRREKPDALYHCFGSFFVSIGTVCVLPFRYEIRILLIFLEKCP
jgi:hypothetical protein